MSGVESKLCFIDTNVWLYAFIRTQDQDKTAIAKTTIQSSEVVISPQIINETCHSKDIESSFVKESIINRS